MSICVRAQEAAQSFFEKRAKADSSVSIARFYAILIICAVTFTQSGCQSSPTAQDSPKNGASANNQTAASNKQTPRETPSPEVRILEDEAMLKGSQAIIGGTVQNISGSNFEGLMVEIELKRRQDEATEKRRAQIEPSRLAPGEQGRYSLAVSREWSSARLLRLYSAKSGADILYTSTRGALRPPERIENKPKVVVVPRPRPKSGEEFINTPDDPVRVP